MVEESVSIGEGIRPKKFPNENEKYQTQIDPMLTTFERDFSRVYQLVLNFSGGDDKEDKNL